MKSNKMLFKAYYKHGLMNVSEVYATSSEEAIKEAHALYRKNAGYVETVTDSKVEDVVDHVELVAI